MEEGEKVRLEVPDTIKAYYGASRIVEVMCCKRCRMAFLIRDNTRMCRCRYCNLVQLVSPKRKLSRVLYRGRLVDAWDFMVRWNKKVMEK